MKKWLLVLGIIAWTGAKAQNEFAANAFIDALRAMYLDGQNGFLLSKGNKIPADSNSFTDEYYLKTDFPMSDSGKLVWPLVNNPYAVLYMEPSRKREDAEARAGNLRAVIEKAGGLVLYARSESQLAGSHYFADTYFYTDPAETRKFMAVFRISVFYFKGKYKLLLEIRGRKP